MTRRDLASLFERRSHARLYPTMRAELDAVRDRRKAIAMELWPRDAIDGDPDHAELVRLARARGLQVVHQPDVSRSGVPIVAVYALYTEQSWRIPALHALWRVVPPIEGWSDGAEALEGHLLGYTRAQITAWLATRRHERLGWHGTTIYLLMTHAQRALLATTGNRYLHPDALASGITATWCDGTRVIKRRPPAWLAKDKLVLARIAIADAAFARRCTGSSTRLDARDAKLVNEALLSAIEFLGRRGWSSRVEVVLPRGALRGSQAPASVRTLRTLFEPYVAPWPGAPYNGDRAELEAVASGEKPMSAHAWPQASIDESDPYYVDQMQLARRLGLTIVHQPSPLWPRTHPQTHVFFLQGDNAWRTNAFGALWEAFPDANGAWSKGAEALEGALLGYTEIQRAAWRTYIMHERMQYGGSTVYLLMTGRARRAITDASNRFISPEAISGITAFASRNGRIREAAPAWLASEQLSVARISVPGPYYQVLFGDLRDGRRMLRRLLRSGDALALNANLRSRVEFLGPRGWS